MAKPLTQQKRDELFEAWCEEPRIPHVVKVCAVTKTTVVKYRDKDNWDARRKIRMAKTAEILDDEAAKETARKLKVLRNVENVYLTALVGNTKCPHCQGKVPVPKMKPKFKDIADIFRLDEMLRGRPDSRPDIGRALDQLSDEALIDLYDRLSADIVSALETHKSHLQGRKLKHEVDEIINMIKE